MQVAKREIAFVPVYSPLHDRQAVEETIKKYLALANTLEVFSFRLKERQELQPEEESLLFIVTGGSEGLALETIAQSTGPVLLLAHPDMNSLPASLEILARLGQIRRQGQVVYLDEDLAARQKLETALRVTGAYRKMQRARLGLIGRPSDWLVASSPDPQLVTGVWGPEVVTIEMAEVLNRLEKVDAEAQKLVVEEFLANAGGVREPNQEDLLKAAGVYLALRELVDSYHLDAFSIRCFDLVLQANTTGCLALSRLLDEGIIAGCEGDLPAALTMMLLSYLSGQIPFMANPARVRVEEKSLWLAHCTIARKLLTSYIVRSHFESGIGVGLQGELQPGPVTLARIGGTNLDLLYAAEGELLETGRSQNLCRTQVKISIPTGVEYFLQRPLGNHHVMVYGDWLDALRSYAELAKVTLV